MSAGPGRVPQCRQLLISRAIAGNQSGDIGAELCEFAGSSAVVHASPPGLVDYTDLGAERFGGREVWRIS